MSTLREAAQAALEQWDKVSGVFRMTAETEALREALRAALAQPEAEPVVEPVAWEARWNDPGEGASYWVPTQNPDFYRSRPNYEVRPLYANPPRDEWRQAVLGALEICMILSDANRDDPERAISDLMGWEPRDVQPPMPEAKP